MRVSPRNSPAFGTEAAAVETGGTSLAAVAPAETAPAEVAPERLGASRERLDGPAKVTGTAPYAYEHPVEEPAYLHPVQATIARGRVTSIDTGAAEAVPGVLAVLTHTNAPRLADTEDAELAVLQSDAVAFRGQFVAAVVAETPESARHAADLVRVGYGEQPHEVELGPEGGTPAARTDHGDLEAAMASAAVVLDRTYTTPMQHNNPMEPHTTIAQWTADGLTLHESTQGVYSVRSVVAPVFGLDPEQVQVFAPHVGGGFGSKGLPHAPLVLTALAAQRSGGRPVKFAVTRQQMFALTGHRTPTSQRIRLAADDRGRLSAIGHDALEHTARIKEFSEGSSTASGIMYAAPNRRITQRLVPRDVPVTSWMRAPGHCPGMHVLETAMDEMAQACGVDPVEFRIRNEPELDPLSGKPFSSRNLVACLREGARRFDWQRRDPAAGVRREGDWLVGTGVAASTYPTHVFPGSSARIRYEGGRYAVFIGAADLGTGAWTALAQIAAEALEVPFEVVDPHIGSTEFPTATVAGGSTGITSWGSAIVQAATSFRDQYGTQPPEGAEAEGATQPNPDAERFSMHAFGAQFAEVRVHADTGEIRVPRMLGVFAAGRIVNARTARSQLIGGMTMGLSMALHEHSVLDSRFGHVVNHDFAGYHIAAHADVDSIEAAWIDEHDPHVNPMGTKGIGEIGIVGAAAAVGNAAYHATGVRVRDLPLTPEKFLR
ncbi:xanthine dehydrogenase molybdenum binding subunit apoprotein [Halopolyspora algeriensis]|uniref:Xanthine dehydrogenase molybdenum binding subunit apoprotein n=1 Tax=Halopolyspora algeriensis TaxID=1500506 RepID=A0A368VRE9_9ACTN|nr:xanthine dehydrogenase family protein molybdopterin-binding subunit [Halopolyspora algeriensis]RCW44490.1 xanthine dehydrogenase molybdenum binding subunit apoprotein [Halopolyspora algeriensis]TQM55851.1 xanthine dehydrogenase molybdenum binding subunit apoprotein [Halopolyspora algeriensis]